MSSLGVYLQAVCSLLILRQTKSISDLLRGKPVGDSGAPVSNGDGHLRRASTNSCARTKVNRCLDDAAGGESDAEPLWTAPVDAHKEQSVRAGWKNRLGNHTVFYRIVEPRRDVTDLKAANAARRYSDDVKFVIGFRNVNKCCCSHFELSFRERLQRAGMRLFAVIATCKKALKQCASAG
jgi:hypothetical protein